MRKLVILAVLAVFIAAGTLLARGAPEEVVTAEVRLEFWFAGAEGESHRAAQIVREYNRQNPNVHVDFVPGELSRERFSAAIAAGDTPDVSNGQHGFLWWFGTDAFHPLEDYLNDPVVGIPPDEVHAEARRSVHFGGHAYAVPLAVVPGSIRYNRELWAAAGLRSPEDYPRSWDELLEVAQILTEVEEGGRVLRYGFRPTHPAWFWQAMLLRNGGEFVDEHLTEYIPEPHQPAHEVLQFLHDLVYEYEVAPLPGALGETIVPEPYMFALEQVALELGPAGEGIFANYEQLNPNLDYAAFAIPPGPSAGDYTHYSLGWDGMFMFAATEHPDEAWDFMRYFAYEKNEEFLEVGKMISPYRRVMDVQRNDPLHADVIENDIAPPNRLRNWHLFPARGDVRATEAGVYERVLFGHMDPAESLAVFKREADAIMNNPEWQQIHREFTEALEFVWGGD